jgi:E3 ubiquitin-protein ligase MARCH1/8
MTLSCGVLFFLAFFVAMYVEVKAKYTIYQVSFPFNSA